MSNREALRDLHSRLASRLQAAQAGEQTASWLGVRAGSLNLLVPLTHAGEIFPWVAPVPVPYAKPWFLGVANLRGGVFGVVDLAEYLGAPRRAPMSEQARSQARLLSFNNLLDLNAALLIDQLLGLRQASQFTSVTPPDPSQAPHWGQRFTTAEGEAWQEINLQHVAATSEFLSVADGAAVH